MVHSKQCHIVAWVVVLGFLMTGFEVQAGLCKGKVVYKDGSKYKNSGISGPVSGGGVTKKFYTDNRGRLSDRHGLLGFRFSPMRSHRGSQSPVDVLR